MEAEDTTPFKAATKRHNEDQDGEHYFVCDSDLLNVIMSCMFRVQQIQVLMPDSIVLSIKLTHVLLLLLLLLNLSIHPLETKNLNISKPVTVCKSFSLR